MPEQHPSYAQIGISRTRSTREQDFYGSRIRHTHYVTLSIKRSERRRELYHDGHFAGEELIRVRLTEHQLAQLITAPNEGEGFPCTVERLHGAVVEDPPRQDDSHINPEFREMANSIAQSLEDCQNRLRVLLETGAKPTRGELKTLRDEMDKAVQGIRSNMPYALACFERSIAATIENANLAIEANAARLGVSNPPRLAD